MKYLTVSLMALTLLGCSKKDIQLYKHYLKQNSCNVASVNANKQESFDFFVLKTYDELGKVTHLKTKIRELHAIMNVYDYDITYADNKAIFKGSKESFIDPQVELIENRDTRSFEVLFDRKTLNPIEVRYVQNQETVLRLSYDHKGYLSRVNDYIVSTDKRGNILSILTQLSPDDYYYPQQLGVYYGYSDREVRGTHQYYETPNSYIHPMYSILEVLGWGPLQPNLERISFTINPEYGDEYIPQSGLNMSGIYSNHKYDSNGNLISYTFDGDIWMPDAVGYEIITYPGRAERTINWQCREEKNK